MPASFGEVKVLALRASQPLTVHLELTYACNWRCVFCYNPRHFDRQRLTREEWEPVLDDLRELGTLTLVLTGGEPMARPDFFEIALEARKRGFALRLFTNGSLITSAEVAKRVAGLHPLSVEMSLHGATAEVHDKTTMKPGSFEAMMEGIRRLQEAGLRLVLKSPVTSINEHQLDEMIALAEGLGIPYQIDAHITPRDNGDLTPLQFAPSRDGLRKSLAIGIRTKTLTREERVVGGANCGIGRVTMAIDPEGNVYPCLQWRHSSLGNVRVTRLRELWHDSPERASAAAISKEANAELVERGGALSEFPFCPALAQQESGSPLVPNKSFIERAELTAALRSELEP